MDNTLNEGESLPATPSRKHKIITVAASSVGVVILCCCCLFSYAAYSNSTPEGKATMTARAQEQENTRVEQALIAERLAIDETSEARPTNTPSPTETAVPTNTPTSTSTPRSTDTPTPTSTPRQTSTPRSTDTPTPTSTPRQTSTPRSTNTPAPTSTPRATNTPAPTSTSRPTAIPNTPVPLPTSPPQPLPTTPPQPVAGQMVIVYVDKRAEFVDIRNTGGQAQDLSGWMLRSERGSQDCGLGGAVEAGATLRIWAMSEDAGQGGFNCGFGSNIWNNSESDPAVLFNAQGVEVSRY